MPLPERYHIEFLRKLKGDAHVSFPGGSTSVKKVERVLNIPRGTTLLVPGIATDEEHTTAYLVEQEILGGDANYIEVYRMYHVLPGVALVRWAVDEETRTLVKITSQLVANIDGVSYSQTDGSTVEYQAINRVYGTKITTTINPDSGGAAQLPSARTEYKLTNYTFPALLFSISGSLVEGRDGTARVKMSVDRRSAFSRSAQAKIEVSYGTRADLETALAAISIFSPRLNDLVYNGVGFSVNEQNVLNDAINLSYTSGTENPKWVYFGETYTASATSPSATTYRDTYIGQYKAVSANISPWRAGWHRLEVVYIKMQ